jgi:sugar phosphate isomerase/epimerase
MNINQLAVQIYTVRDYLSDQKGIVASMKKIRKIGYTAVEVIGLGSIDNGELVRILDGEGLTCCSAHDSPSELLNQSETIIERINKLGCQYIAYTYPEDVDLSTTNSVKDFARKLEATGRFLSESGHTLLYHNHDIEFQRRDGKLILDIIYDNTDSTDLQAELDTYWIQHGGGDPVNWCRKMNKRMPILHIKDYIMTEIPKEEKPFPCPDEYAIESKPEPMFAEIGHGNLDWKRIIAQAEESGCKWFIVEQDTCPGDPFDSLKISFDYVQENLI